MATVTKKGFNRQQNNKLRTNNIPRFLVLTKGDLELVKNLKLQTFTQFKDISNTFTKRLADKIYQDTLVGREFVDLEKELRQTINGIYSKTNDKEAQKLVDFVKRNKNVKSMQSRVDKVVIQSKV